MSPATGEKTVWHFGINYAAACLLFVALLALVKWSVPVPAVDADRAAARSKALAEIHAAETAALNQPGWVDADRGIVRLPVETAMQIVGRDTPLGVRAALIDRQEKASAPLPKTAPKPSAFE